MLAARPSLMELMVTERAEAEAWLAADWSPQRRWVVAADDLRPQSLDVVARHMVAETAVEGWYGLHIAFVDDVPVKNPRTETAWVISGDSDAAEAWRAHLAPLVRAALEQALETFPLTWAGREIKDAITHPDSHGDGFDEIWEGSGTTGLSDGAEDYLELLSMSPDWMCHGGEWPEMIGAHLWRRYRVLSDEIMAMLDAADAAEALLG